LAQTPPPGLEIPNPEICTYPELLEFVTPLAGEMLYKYVQDTYLRSHDHGKEALPIIAQSHGGDVKHAPKITTADSEIDWENWTAEDMLRRDRILGRLWTKIRHRDENGDHEKRVIFQSLEIIPATSELITFLREGKDFYRFDGIPFDAYRNGTSLLIGTKLDNQLLNVKSVIVEGKNKQDAWKLCRFAELEGTNSKIKQKVF